MLTPGAAQEGARSPPAPRLLGKKESTRDCAAGRDSRSARRGDDARSPNARSPNARSPKPAWPADAPPRAAAAPKLLHASPPGSRSPPQRKSPPQNGVQDRGGTDCGLAASRRVAAQRCAPPRNENGVHLGALELQAGSSPISASPSSITSDRSYTSVPTDGSACANTTLSPAGSLGSKKMPAASAGVEETAVSNLRDSLEIADRADSPLEHESHGCTILRARQRSAQRCARPVSVASVSGVGGIGSGDDDEGDDDSPSAFERMEQRVEQMIADTQVLLRLSLSPELRGTSSPSPARKHWSPAASVGNALIADQLGRPLFDFSPSPSVIALRHALFASSMCCIHNPELPHERVTTAIPQVQHRTSSEDVDAAEISGVLQCPCLIARRRSDGHVPALALRPPHGKACPRASSTRASRPRASRNMYGDMKKSPGSNGLECCRRVAAASRHTLSGGWR